MGHFQLPMPRGAQASPRPVNPLVTRARFLAVLVGVAVATTSAAAKLAIDGSGTDFVADMLWLVLIFWTFGLSSLLRRELWHVRRKREIADIQTLVREPAVRTPRKSLEPRVGSVTDELPHVFVRLGR